MSEKSYLAEVRENLGLSIDKMAARMGMSVKDYKKAEKVDAVLYVTDFSFLTAQLLSITGALTLIREYLGDRHDTLCQRLGITEDQYRLCESGGENNCLDDIPDLIEILLEMTEGMTPNPVEAILNGLSKQVERVLERRGIPTEGQPLSLGQILKVMRFYHGITIEEIAEDLSVSTNTYINWESDKTTPPVLQLLKFADRCGEDPDLLLYNYKENEIVVTSELEEMEDTNARKDPFLGFTRKAMVAHAGIAECEGNKFVFDHHSLKLANIHDKTFAGLVLYDRYDNALVFSPMNTIEYRYAGRSNNTVTYNIDVRFPLFPTVSATGDDFRQTICVTLFSEPEEYYDRQKGNKYERS